MINNIQLVIAKMATVFCVSLSDILAAFNILAEDLVQKPMPAPKSDVLRSEAIYQVLPANACSKNFPGEFCIMAPDCAFENKNSITFADETKITAWKHLLKPNALF